MTDEIPQEWIEAGAKATVATGLRVRPSDEYLLTQAVLAAVLPLIRPADEERPTARDIAQAFASGDEQRGIVLAAEAKAARSADAPQENPEPPWEYVHRCPSCGRYFDSPSRCLPDGVMTVPVRERVPNGVRCLAMDGRCERVAGHAGPCVEGERGN